ncbi:cytochrome bo3 quinol oxidase subunit 4 [Hasllibacter halocynthiae]|uniref:Cytochrome bo(3) ubiquinol oxidase subunit 4 n=1 Tax=Hasllibacter halocynthiae TaxID=595589 RepID=A0A2T0X4D7_9RHOB|nr:cytochrome C oxidase subunit IV family protein [Hasllibacter halocynthiae]PRY93801.1 cytochrome bo3 quinol oxidase subunit 4 [Hasllibacter halocynthiae]
MKDDARSEMRRYAIGAVLSAALTLLAFWAVMSHGMARSTALWIVGAAALAQIVVQMRCFLHVGSSSKREDLHLILFSLVLGTLMVGGTIWIMSSLHDRMY